MHNIISARYPPRHSFRVSAKAGQVLSCRAVWKSFMEKKERKKIKNKKKRKEKERKKEKKEIVLLSLASPSSTSFIFLRFYLPVTRLPASSSVSIPSSPLLSSWCYTMYSVCGETLSQHLARHGIAWWDLLPMCAHKHSARGLQRDNDAHGLVMRLVVSLGDTCVHTRISKGGGRKCRKCAMEMDQSEYLFAKGKVG